MKEYVGMSKANVKRRIYQMLQAGKLETRQSKDKKAEELRIKRAPESKTPESKPPETGAVAPDRDRDATERQLREMWKDLDAEKLERMIQGVFGAESTETQA